MKDLFKSTSSNLLSSSHGGRSGKQPLKANSKRFSILILAILTIAALTAVWMLPSTAEESVVEISTLEQLKTFRDNVNNGVSADINVKLTGNINLEGNESNQWTPIGSDDTKPFKGNFDGNSCTISGLYISTDKDFQGLFGFVSSDKAEVKNLTVSGSVAGGHGVGMVAGGINKGTIKNCTAEGSVSGIGNGEVGIGGIVGGCGDCEISNCTAKCSVSGGYVGGIVGSIESFNATVKNCTVTGKVSGEVLAGGIMGIGLAAVTNCVATGDVSFIDIEGVPDDITVIGGIIGGNFAGAVTDCVATGGISANKTEGQV